jgi:hypothetical protein
MHIRRIALTVSSLLLSFAFAGTALANVQDVSFDPSFGESFTFYCAPYTETFVVGGQYNPNNNGCVFSQPNSISQIGNGYKIVGIYRGVPGNATLISGDGVFSGATLVTEDASFGTPANGQDFFATVWSYDTFGGTTGSLGSYLSNGSTIPANAVLGKNYYILPWKWFNPNPPPPADVCPLVNGDQPSGPCASDQCVSPASWDVATQNCVTPPPTFTFLGFDEPINNTGHQITANTSVFKAGSTVPVKLTFKNALTGQVTQLPTNLAWIAPVKGPALSAPVSEATYTDQPSSGNTYEWSSDHYQYNWKTNKSDAGYWYYLYVVEGNNVYYTIVGLR